MSFHLNEYLSIERKYKGRANQYIKLQVTNFLDASILESKIMHFTLCPYDIK